MEENIRRRIAAEPRHERVLYRILGDCQTPIALAELEEKIRAYPEMHVPVYEPAVLISWLVEAEALSASSCGDDGYEGHDDEAGEIRDDTTANETVEAMEFESGVTQQSEMPSDEQMILAITDAGRSVWNARQEADEVGQLLSAVGPLKESFLRTLEICQTPQSKKAVEQQLVAEGFLNLKERQVSYFLDKLEKAGALVWDKGWISTQEGLAKLA